MKIPEKTPLSELRIQEAGLIQQLNLVQLEMKRQQGLHPFNKPKTQ